MNGKTFLVTGAAGGIGSAIVIAFAAKGARLVLLGRKREALAELADAVRGAGGDARPLVADLLGDDPSDIARRAVVAFGGLDGIVNCAGVQHFGLAADEPAAASAQTFAVNAVAPIQLIQALLPHLQQRPVAHVVNVGSIFGSIGFPCFATYSASKFALRGYSEALRRELAGGPVRVHYIAPRYTRTAMNRDAVVRMADALGMKQDSPEAVAERVLAAVEKDAADVYLGWPERLFVRINAILPRLVDGALIRQAVRPARTHRKPGAEPTKLRPIATLAAPILALLAGAAVAGDGGMEPAVAEIAHRWAAINYHTPASEQE